MKRLLTVIGLILLVAVFSSGVVLAGETVTCTVTPKVIAIEVTPGLVDYGVLDLGTSKSTLDFEPAKTLTAKNTGSVDEKFEIRSSDASGTTTPWTLVTASSIGTNAFAHQYKGGAATDWTDFESSSTTKILKASVAKDETVNFDLQILMPTSTTDSGEKTITVTVLATGLP